MNVYLVWSGMYSDAHVKAVFSTMEKAEEYIAKFDSLGTLDDCLDGPHIEKMPVDFLIDAQPRQSWIARIKCDSGELYKCEPWGIMIVPDDYSEPGRYISLNQTIITAISTVSQEHANKLAIEGRQAWLRMRDLRIAD